MSAAYYRVSTDRQGRSGLGLDAQREAVHGFLGCAPAAEFVEVESGKRADRPKLAEALAYAKRHGCQLIVAKLDRLARDVKLILAIVDSGVRVRFLDIPEIDPDDPAGRLMLTMLASFAEFERRIISKRTKAALAVKKARGFKLGSPNPSAGGQAAAKANAETAERVAAKALPVITAHPGASLREMARILTAEGVPTYTGGRIWHPSSVAKIKARLI